MPVTDQTPLNSSTANGVSTVFPYDFYVSAETDLVVTVDGDVQTLNVDYTVSGVGNQDGGDITFLSAPANLQVVTRYRNTTLTRSTDYQTNGDLLAQVLDNDLDRLWLALQEIFSGGKGAPTAIRVPPGEVVPALPQASSRANMQLAFDSNGDPVVMVPISGSAADVLVQLANKADATKGSGIPGFNILLNYAVQTIGAAVVDSPAQMIWWVTDEAERTAIKAGTSTTDHTALVQGALAFVGAKGLDFGPSGWVWNLSGTLNCVAGATYQGSAKLRAKNAAAMLHIFRGTSVSGVRILNLEIDGNVDNTGSTGHGIYFSGGTDNRVIGTHVHDTYIAGYRGEAETDPQVLFNRFLNCGRAGPSDNHGMMIGSNGAGNFIRGKIIGNIITNAYRKGLAVYCFSTGYVDGTKIIGNDVTNCGLGGIYIAGDEAMTHVIRNITLEANTATDNYVNYEIASVSRITCNDNSSHYTNVTGKLAGWYIAGSHDVSITGGINDFSPQHGVMLVIVGATPNKNINIHGMQITRCNQLNVATAAGVYVTDTTDSQIDCDISDETGKMTHGVLEFTGGDRNYLGGSVKDALTASYVVTGADTVVKKEQIKQATVTYSANMTPNNMAGATHEIVPTNGVAFTINPFSNPFKGHRNVIRIKNTTGGALGAATWNSYKMSAWTNPATGFSRSIEFEFNGTNWVQVSQTGVDIPN